MLALTILASCPHPAFAQPTSCPQRPIMPPSIRPAMPHDVPAMVVLLGSMDPLLWRIAADASIGIERALPSALNGPQAARAVACIVGIAHAMLVPVPPIYDSSAGSPGLLLDDCY